MTDTAPPVVAQPAPYWPAFYTGFLAWLDGNRFRPIALALAAGALLSRAYSPIGAFPVIFIALPAAFILVERAATWRAAAWSGWLFGFGFLAAGWNWIAISFTQQSQVPAVLAPFAVSGLAAAMALYYALMFAVCRWLWHSAPSRVVLFAALWTAAEMLRGVLFTGFPWHLVGSLWADWLWPAQSVWLISVYGLSLITVWLAASLIPALQVKRGRWAPIWPLALAGLVWLALLGWGGMRLASHPMEFHDDLHLRLVQANISQREKWIPALIEDHFDRHLTLSRGSDPGGQAANIDLLIWPEVTVQRLNFSLDGSLHRWRLSRLLRPGSIALVGGRRPEGRDPLRVYNSLFAVSAEGDILAAYDKRHLVPFGEYLPLPNLLTAFGLSQLTGGTGLTAGSNAEAIEIAGIPPFRALICYEIIFPGSAADPARKAEWLLNITNDGWFGISEGPYQHFAMARLRAIEEGLPVVRSAGGGVSAVIGPLGRTHKSLDLNQAGIVDSRLPKPLVFSLQHISTKTRIFFIMIFITVVLIHTLYRRKTLS